MSETYNSKLFRYYHAVRWLKSLRNPEDAEFFGLTAYIEGIKQAGLKDFYISLYEAEIRNATGY